MVPSPKLMDNAKRAGIAICLCCGVGWGAEPEPDPSELPRIPGKRLEEARKSFVVREGLRVELAAGEPEVVDPVAIAFDEKGRMFVAEMRGYPERREEALGRIKLLEDTDNDGRYEKATVFAEGLKWPTGVVCWKGGVFVTASPEILYFADRDGDGVADERETVFTGFGAGHRRLNMQALVNGLQWGPDGRIYGATASNGGSLVRSDVPGFERFPLRGSDFSFDPETRDLRRESGTAQFGLSFDDFGRRYVCSNSRHLIAVMYSWPWNRVFGLPHPLVDIAVDGGAAEVFRLSQVEPWRVVRTRWRVQGLVGGPVEGGGRAAGYFTSASGLTVYRGDAFPEEYRGNVFVGDVGSNLVHRKVIEFPPERVQPVARRAAGEERREFLASTDNWFRPVQCANGPDGALYIVDMYRETIEHPWSIPESIKKHLDLYSGNDRGRIWRVVPEGRERPEVPNLAPLGAKRLVGQLESKNGWRRDAAARLLIERFRGNEEVEQAVEQLSLGADLDPATRVQCQHLLNRFGRLQSWSAKISLDRFDAEARRVIIELLDELPPELVVAAAKDPDPRVRFALALRLRDPEVKAGADTFIALLGEAESDPWILQTVAMAARKRGVFPEVAGAQKSFVAAKGLVGKGLVESTDPTLRPLLARAAKVAVDVGAEAAEREAARWLLGADTSTTVATLWEWVDGEDAELAATAARAITKRVPKGWEEEVFTRWSRMPPSLREVFMGQIPSAPMMTALERGVILPSEVPFVYRRVLLTNNSRRIAERARAVLGGLEVQSRSEALAHYRPAVKLEGEAERGQAVFTQRCAVCHEKRGELASIGPPTETLRNKGAPLLLENIIVPDREIAPQYVLWELGLKGGKTEAGMIANERADGLTVHRVDGSSVEIKRAEIERLTNLNRSLMPAGLEAGLSVQEMADLLAFLTGEDR